MFEGEEEEQHQSKNPNQFSREAQGSFLSHRCYSKGKVSVPASSHVKKTYKLVSEPDLESGWNYRDLGGNGLWLKNTSQGLDTS